MNIFRRWEEMGTLFADAGGVEGVSSDVGRSSVDASGGGVEGNTDSSVPLFRIIGPKRVGEKRLPH